MKEEKIKKAVREGYAEVAKTDSTCYTAPSSCCGGADLAKDISRNIGYTDEDIEAVPDGANLGLGCGNPVALASLEEGDVLLDLGSGAGFDSFIAARQVGRTGWVIGVDMTPEMLDKARENARKGGYDNVEFRLGEIEHLPVADNSVDVIISNCVINLVPDKKAVFNDAFRVLKPGGRLMVSDIVLLKELPAAIKESVSAYVGCLAGAAMKDEYIGAIKSAGFANVEITEDKSFPIKLMANDPTAKAVMENMDIPPEKSADVADSAHSISVRAVKP
ncbi:MAG: arsenite methyltransferase [Actinobacteria bacterium]|nr:arsenite methyltransferase [Actinomycetota bacterium]